MIPERLVSVYLQYKQGTDFVASWLASTAKSCGYSTIGSTTSASDTVENTNSGKHKGKPSAKETTCKTVVAIKDFVPMAQIIASHKPRIKVSQFFLKTLDTVIEMRSSFGKHLALNGVTHDSLSDQSHCHFVNVLRQVRKVLQPCCSSPDEATPSHDPVVQEVTNAFGRLELFEPSQKFLSTPAIPKSELPIDQIEYEAEVPSSEGDSMTAFALLINDLNSIRKIIMGIWGGQIEDALDLTTCGIATNTAIDLARNLIAQVELELREYGGTCGVCRLIFEDFAQAEGCTGKDVLNDWELCTDDNLYYVGAVIYFDILDMIESFANDLSPKYDTTIGSDYTGMPSLFKQFDTEFARDRLEHNKAKMAAL